MRPHPKIRWFVKWAGLVMGVVMVAAWVASVRPSFLLIVSNEWSVYIDVGWIGIARFPTVPKGWESYAGGYDYEQPPKTLHDIAIWGVRFSYWRLWMPIWLPLSCILLPTAAAWRLDALARRRARTTQCFKCSYDRRGLAAGAVCPECGADAPATTV